MTTEEVTRQLRLKSLFEGALETTPKERDSWLCEQCTGDRKLLEDARRLLADDERLHQAAPAKPEDLPQFGPWQAIRLLGRGGMGVVHLAERADGAFRMRAAVKVVPLALASHDIEERFRRERQFLASLEHPKIARLIDGGLTNTGVPYLVMDYVDGLPIDRYCEAHHLDARARIAMMRQVLEALAYVHGQQVLHRDLKSSNILVDAAGNVKLLDFGTARLSDVSGDKAITQTGVFAFTPECASPEQAQGKAVTYASDIYSAGVLLYRLLTGRPPYQVTNQQSAATAEPEPSGLDAPLDAIVSKALRKNPEERYRSAQEMDSDLERYLQGQPVEARQASKAGAIGLVVALAGIGAIAGWLDLHRGATPPPPSIAVLPFTGDGYIGSGMRNEIFDLLARSKGPRVVAQASAAQAVAEFKGKPVDYSRVGRRLKVTHVLTASVEQSADRINVSASLIRTSDGANVWTNSYRRPLEFLSLIEGELQNAVTGSLGFGKVEERRHAPPAEAHELYLKACFELNQATPASNALAQQDFRSALQIDPDYADAWERLAAAIWNRPTVADEKPTPDEARRALECDEKALRLDPGLPRAHVGIGMYAFHYDWDWARAEREFRKALDGQHAGAEQMLSGLYLSTGRRAEADEHQRRARDLDPISNPSIGDTADFLFYEGRYAEARARYQELAQQSPNPAWRHGVDSCDMRLNPEVAIGRLRKIARPTAADLEDLAIAEGLAGHSDKALRIIHSLESHPSPDVGNMDFASMYAVAGDEASTVKYLDRAIDTHEVGVSAIHVYPDFAKFQNTAEFHRLKKRVNLDW